MKPIRRLITIFLNDITTVLEIATKIYSVQIDEGEKSDWYHESEIEEK